MKRQPRLLPCIALACTLSFPLLYGVPARAQTAPSDNPPPTAPATAPAATPAPTAAGAPDASPAASPETVGQKLPDQVDDFWHYGEIGRYDLQASIGKKLIAEGQQSPEELLKTFEQVAAQHHQLGGAPTDLDSELLRWQAADPQMQPVATQILDLLNKGRFARRQNLQYISQNIHRLNQGERAYMLAMRQLRNSGELAVPQMVGILTSQSPDDVQLHDVIRRALVDLGRSALNPLLAATRMDPKDPALTTICGVLGDIGYPIAGPYLVALVHGADSSNEVKQAATVALQRLNVNPNSNAGNLFYSLAEKFYYGSASIQPDPRSPKAFVWYWSNGNLTNKAVPPPIFNDIMAMRETEHALRQNASQPDQAIALWLSANVRRGIDLPQGETDPTRAQGEPEPHYYNVAEGAKYLNLALARSLKDNTPQSSAVALAVVKSLADIVGQSNLFTGGQGQPLVDAMRYSDRQVRFEAAFALAAALPQKPFQGQNRVVPLLAEAVSQSGTPGVLIVAPQNDRTRLAADLKNFAVAGGSDPSAAMADAASIPAVDVIVMSEDLSSSAIDQVMNLASQNPGLERAAKLIIVHSLASPWARMSITDPTISYTEATGGEGLIQAIDAARKRAGGLPMDQKLATDFALRAAHLLTRLAISGGQVFDLNSAEQQLISALSDKRPQIVQAVAGAVAMLHSARAQQALADKANDSAAAPDIRISLYKSVATSAKFNGNKLDDTQVGALQGVVADEKNLDIRSAAAEARGALNLPATDSKGLIVGRHD